jgi:ubiquinone biosynthesis protein UbiJ
MLAQLNAQILNHLLSQNPGAAELLRRFAGKTLALALPPLQIRLFILDSGSFASAQEAAEMDATLSLPPGAALRFLAERRLDTAQLSIEGDSELATEVGKVLQGLRWDVEEDLSHIVGDIPAHQLTQAGSRIKSALGRQAVALAGMFADYWQEEQPLIAKRRHGT